MRVFHIKVLFLFPLLAFGQIEKQVRDDSPGLFKNQRIFHSTPKPFFKSRSEILSFVTNIPSDSIFSSTLFFKTNVMESYQEFKLEEKKGLFEFLFDPETYPGNRVQYYFIIETKNAIYGTPISDDGKLTPVNKLLVDPVQYFKQQARLNR